ncbi:flagellar hook-basal body complex protein [Patulibacter brassicae]|jgi:flagellar hook protein FlgE|uniref:Flagellar hook protein FlgE n=1 Tax=Patulibacter brassicae TaxID=1705717 RepID=A0ABU4VM10_9ACTN|nr:flagellar hook-basal body complex protein [Patulibacter brassicae]MDX8152857.1 flagellar hook-basal body complex protein [Patulibacter brassicae]
MYSAISGLKAHQTMLDVTANNLANANTVGYKASRTTFADSLSQSIRGAAGPTAETAGTNAAQVGLGVRVSSIDNLVGTSATQMTGNPTDVALQGEGWFSVVRADPSAPVPANGSWSYTRAGNFTTTATGHLTTPDGLYVLGYGVTGTGTPDVAGGPRFLQLPAGASDVAVGSDGSVSYVDHSGGPLDGTRQTAGFIAVSRFPNQAGLQRQGGNLWSATANSGAPTTDTPGVNGNGALISGALEMSNVDLASEFTTMISAQRGFQANSRVITVADDMLQEVVNMKR